MISRTYSIFSPGSATPDLQLHCDPIEMSRACEVLVSAEVSIVGQLANSSNSALLGAVSVGEADITCVIKPAMYENPLVDFEWGTLVKREVASYELSHLLGWDIIPPTVLRDVNDMQSCVQLFIPHDPRVHYFSIAATRQKEMERFIVFDYIANNADRKAGHILAEEPQSFDLYIETRPEITHTSLTETKMLWGIDHGLTFHTQDKLRTVMWDYSEEPISSDLLSDIQRVIPRLEEVLSPFLSGYEIEATALRIEKILLNPYHRALDSTQRAFPWPLV